MEAETHGGDARRLADFLRARHDEIVGLWEREVRRLRPARTLSRPVLLDHIPDFLRQLGSFVDELREGHDPTPPQEFPIIHAIERLDLGYDIADVVSEYAILRRCIIQLAVNDASPAVRSAQMPRLHEALDQAIAASLNRYAQARERTLKALDRISTAALGDVDVDVFLPRILSVLLQTTATVDAVSVLLIEGDLLRVRASVGFALNAEEAPPLKLGECFAGRIWRTGEPALTRDAMTDPVITTDTIRKRGTHALYGVPLLFGDMLIGVALMGSCSTYEFSHEDLLLFRTAATRAAAIVAQARLDAQVKRQHALYETLLKAQSDVGEGFALVENEKLVYVNGAFAAMLGYQREDVIGKHPMDFVTPPLREALHRERDEGGNPRAVYETQLQHRDGSAVDVELAVNPLDEHRRVVICRDIRERKRFENELQAGIEFRDRIMGVLSHDLRQPLMVITTSIGLLQSQPGLEAHARVLERQLRSARRMDRMIRDLIEYSRSRHGDIKLQLAGHDAGELVRQAVDALQAVHPERTFHVTTDGDCTGRWDSDRLLQAFGNLLGNAVTYSPAGTAIDVSVKCVRGSVEIAFHNQGAPIPAEKLPTIFEPFRRASEGAHPEGLGLGLYIVQQLVFVHGGTVEVESSAEAGTTFTVRLPRGPPAA